MAMRTSRTWTIPVACLALALAGCPGGGPGADGAGEDPAADAPRAGMDFEVTHDTQRVHAPGAGAPEAGDHDPDD
jgi:hypothetical protein